MRESLSRMVVAAGLAAGLAAIAIGGAGPAQAALKDDYMSACMTQTSNNTELCTCKAEQAVRLADEEMLGYIVTAMQDGEKFRTQIEAGQVPERVIDAWGPYVMKSNLVCRPGD